eukprot:10661370-Ditylum_brightwellii.AAC.1
MQAHTIYAVKRVGGRGVTRCPHSQHMQLAQMVHGSCWAFMFMQEAGLASAIVNTGQCHWLSPEKSDPL